MLPKACDEMLAIRMNLATMLAGMGDYDGAIRLGKEHVGLGPTQRLAGTVTLANWQLAAARYEEAEAALKRALPLAREHGNPSFTADLLVEQGRLYMLTERQELAEETLQEARKLYGDHKLITAMGSDASLALAELRHEQGRDAQAALLLQEAERRVNKAWFPATDLKAICHSRQARLRLQMEDYEAAEAAARKALAANRARAQTEQAAAVLADALAEQGNLREAREVLEDAIAFHESCYGDAHPYVARLLKQYAEVRKGLGDTDAATKAMERADGILDAAATSRPAARPATRPPADHKQTP